MSEDRRSGINDRKITIDPGIYIDPSDTSMSRRNMIPLFMIATFCSIHLAYADPLYIKENVIILSMIMNPILPKITYICCTCVTYENRYTIPTENPPIIIPRMNRLRFHGVSNNRETPYPQRYIGRRATKNAKNDKRIKESIISYFL